MAMAEPLSTQKHATLAKNRVVAGRDWQLHVRHWALVSDLVVVVVAVMLAQCIRFGEVSSDQFLTRHGPPLDPFTVSGALAALWLSALAISETRSPLLIGDGLEESRRVLTATVSTFGIVAVISTLFKLEVARGYLAIALPVGVVGLLLGRWLLRRCVARRRLEGSFTNAVVAVGTPGSVHGLAASFAQHPADGLRLVGACGPGLHADRLRAIAGRDVQVFGDGESVLEAVRGCGADTVVLASGHLSPDEIRDLSWQLDGLDVDLVVAPGMVDIAAPRLTMQLVGGHPLIRLEKPQYHGAKHFQKRAFDLVFSSLLLCVVTPVMIVAALAIKLSSRGPVFYLSERVGLDGASFRMIKFRTMVVDADQRLAEIAHLNESEGGVLFKIRRDPRVTPVGAFLRRYSIDELPQFFNVLRGEMSVVGPRPPLPREADTYDLRTRRRLLVRPGITGLWQVSGRSDLSWDESVRLDLSYVENWSMAGDLVIAMSTVRAVLRASGAY